MDMTLKLTDDNLELIDNADNSLLHSHALDDTSAIVISGSDFDDTLTIDFENPFDVLGRDLLSPMTRLPTVRHPARARAG